MSGTVTVPGGGDPTSIGVSIYNSDYSYDNSTSPDSTGAYSFTGVPAGTYTVEFDDWSGTGTYLSQYWKGAANSSSATPVVVTSGATVDGINATMTTAGSITGTLAGPGGAVPTGATFTVYDSNWNQVGSATSFNGSSYVIGGLTTGSYYVLASDPADDWGQQWYSGAMSRATATAIAVTSGSVTTGKNFVLNAGGTVAGTVALSDGADLSQTYVNVSITDGDGDQVGWASTDETGAYSVAGLAPGTYSMQVSASGYTTINQSVTVVAGSTLRENETLVRLGDITGTITAPDGTPVANVQVTAYDSSGDGYSALTDDQGDFDFGGLPAAVYTVEAAPSGLSTSYLAQWWKDADSQTDATPITVGNGTTVGSIDFQLAPGATISGVVTDASTGAPIANASVSLVPQDQHSQLFGVEAQTDDNGAYTLTGLTPGIYEVQVSGPQGSNYIESYVGGNSKPTVIDITGTESVTDENVQLGAGATISGVITDASTGATLSNVGVQAVSEDGNFTYYFGSVDQNGNYSISGLPAGQYGFSAWDYDGGGGYLSVSIMVTAGGAGTTVTQNIALTPAYAISGRVVDANGRGIANTRVDAYDASGDQVNSAETGDDGSYEIADLPAGSYRLRSSGSASVVWYPSAHSEQQGTLVDVTDTKTAPGRVASNVDITATKLGSFYYSVVNAATGAPVNADVEVGNAAAPDVAYSSGANGEIAGLATGGYTATVSAAGYADLSQSVTIGATAQTLTFKLTPTPTVHGTITGLDADSPAVTATATNGDVYSANIGSAGYSFANIPVGTYSLSATAGPRTVSATLKVVASPLSQTGPTLAFGGEATISGTVRTAAGTPVDGNANATVTATDAAGNTAYTSIASNGTYAFTDLALDTAYTIFVEPFSSGTSAADYSLGTYYQSSSHGVARLDEASTVTTGASGSTTTANITALAAYSITGKVTGAGLSALYMQAFGINGDPAGGAAVAADGTFEIDGLAPGSYVLEFGQQQFQYDVATTSAGEVTVPLGADQHTYDVGTLAEPSVFGALGSLSGTVTAGGAPVTAGTITVFNAAGNSVYSGGVGDDGKYSVQGLTAGSYTIEYNNASGLAWAGSDSPLPLLGSSWYGGTTATAVTLSTGQSASGLNIALVEGGSLTGTVTDASKDELADVTVMVYNASGQLAGEAVTESDGSYEVTGLGTGSYTLLAQPFQGSTAAIAPVAVYYGGTYSRTGASVVKVTNGSTTAGINIALPNGGTISGTVTYGGQPAANVGVSIFAPTGGGASYYAQTDDAGKFTVSGIQPGSEEVEAYPRGGTPSAGAAATMYSTSATGAASTITVTAGAAATPISIALSKGATISGTVTDTSGHPLSGVAVSATPVATAASGVPAVGGDTAGAAGYDPGDYATTAADGTYTLTGLAAGSYDVRYVDYGANGGWAQYYSQYWKDATSQAAATPISVTANATSASSISGVDLALSTTAPAQAITPGTVKITGTAKVGDTLTAEATGWPAAATVVFQWYANGSAITGATGSTLKLTGAQAGKTITVQATRAQSGFQSASVTSTATAKVAVGTLTAPTPTISGTSKVGDTLTAAPGSWTAGTTFAYQWYEGTTKISGATASKYTIPASYVGKTFKVTVTGSQTGYTSLAKTSVSTKAAAAGTLTAATPTISGTAAVGQTLTVSRGTWSSGVSFSYQWYASGAAISKAAGSSLKLTPAQKGKTITVKVTGKRSGYTTAAKTSKATGKVTAGLITGPTPTISGTAKVGSPLTAKPGTWSTGATLAYHWYANGKVISGATKSTFTPTSAQFGATIKVAVTGSRSGYTSSTKTSASTKAVAVGTLTAPTPKISGIAAVGQTLTAVPGAWTSGTALSYQWLAGGIEITGATSSTFKVTSAQNTPTALAITVTVTGKKTDYTTASRTSAATAKVTAGVVTGPKPKITGTAKVGSTLKVTAGTWTTGSSLGYQWLANGTAISKATGTSFKLTTAQLGKAITVRVTGSKSGYTSTSETSAATSKVGQGTLSAPTPTVSGTLLVGHTLSASHSGWTSGAKLTYQWYRGGTAIKGATGSTYKLVAADAPNVMSVHVTGKLSGYTTATKKSAATGRVSPGDTKNCSDFATHAQAQKWFNTYYPYFGDVAKLDGDHDGIACEDLP